MAKITKNCLDLVKEFEGCYLRAYKDEVGVWTIGYGITNSDKSITKTTIKSGLTISKATAESWLEKSLTQKYLPLVMKYNDKYKWNQNEIDALVSFCYNIGSIKGLTANGTRSDIWKCKWIPYDKNGRSDYYFFWLLPSCNIIQQNKTKSWLADDSKDMCVYVDYCNGTSTVVLIN